MYLLLSFPLFSIFLFVFFFFFKFYLFIFGCVGARGFFVEAGGIVRFGRAGFLFSSGGAQAPGHVGSGVEAPRGLSCLAACGILVC